MVRPRVERKTLFPKQKIIVFISLFLILMFTTIFATYHQLYDVPLSFNNRPCNHNASQYKTLEAQAQPAISLGNNEKFDLLYVEENLHTLDQKDPQLIQYTRVRHLTPPSKQPYNLGNVTNITAGPAAEFTPLIVQLFGNKRNGVFIEAGANEGGATSSHTLYLEKEMGWSGILIECNPTVVPYLRTKHRKAWIADVCLSPTGHAETLNFSSPTTWSYSGTLGKAWRLDRWNWTYFDVQAIPLYTILAGLGWKEVDYFCFDVEGQELAILRNFPFDLFRFKVLIYEEQFTTADERSELDNLLKKNGYVFLKKMRKDKVYIDGEFYKELVTMKKV